MEPLIKCNGLSLGYDGNILVSELDFHVNRGDYLCVVGENGSGKSTLMRTLLRLQAPVSGEITYGDGLSSNEVGYLPQQTQVQRDFPASVREIVLSGCQGRSGFRPFYSSKEKQLAEEIMNKLGLEKLKTRCYRDLSGGQQQRVLLARALCATRKVLLLDEPVSGLDPKVALGMYELIKDLNEKEGIAIIMITHDISASFKYASHVLHVGKNLFFGKKEAYFESEIGKLFLNVEKGA